MSIAKPSIIYSNVGGQIKQYTVSLSKTQKEYTSYIGGPFPPPKLNIFSEGSLKEIYQYILKQGGGTDILPKHIVHYLWQYCRTFMKTTGKSDIYSYGLPIEGTDVDPTVFFEVIPSDTFVTSSNHDRIGNEYYHGMTFYIVMLYKVENISISAEYTEYKNLIMQQFNSHRLIFPFRYTTDMSSTNPLSQIIKSPQIFQLMAAMDYFLYHHDLSHLTLLHKGTILIRYEGLHMIEVLDHFRTLLSLEVGDLAGHHQCSRMQRNEPPLQISSGVFPYQRSLGLVDRSIFSAGANPYLHTFYSMSAYLYKDRRFINAQNLEPGCLYIFNSLYLILNISYIQYDIQYFI
uniref:Rhabdovirus nucleocapsid domain-containing protein n=1 Tax=Octopus bimaculoides TaxID=37653 RepID=A0A0L8FVJ3_OCTBM